MASTISQAKARLSALSRHRDPDDPAVLVARAELEAAVRDERETRRKAVQSDPELREIRISQVIKREAEGDPPLSHVQRVRLAGLLLPAGDSQAQAKKADAA